MKKTAWVCGNHISDSFLGLVHYASDLAVQKNIKLKVIMLCLQDIRETAGMIYESGADEVLRFPVSELDINAEPFAAQRFAEMAEEEMPEFILFESSSFNCSVAPMLAALLNCGITADCTDLSWSSEGTLIQTRPAFGGKKLANNVNTCVPAIATVRKGVFSYYPGKKAENNSVGQISCGTIQNKWLVESLSGMKHSACDLTEAKIILSGGLGLGSKENFARLYTLAELIGAEVGASRAAVAAGFAGYERQIGQTGTTVRPEVYVAFGISGAVQHLSGMSGAKYIYAVNKDPKAQIHKYSDYSIIADCVEVIDNMITALERCEK